MNIIKKIIRKLVNSFGIDIVKLEKPSGLDNPYCQYSKVRVILLMSKGLEKCH